MLAHGGAELVDGVLVAAGAHQRVAEVVALAGDVGSDGHRPLELRDRLLRLADLGQEEPEHLQRVGIFGLNPQQRPHRCDRCIHPTRLGILHRALKWGGVLQADLEGHRTSNYIGAIASTSVSSAVRLKALRAASAKVDAARSRSRN